MCHKLSEQQVLSDLSRSGVQLMLSKFEYDGKLNPSFKTGQFELPMSRMWSYAKQPQTPRFVLVSSAGVTRPGRYSWLTVFRISSQVCFAHHLHAGTAIIMYLMYLR